MVSSAIVWSALMSPCGMAESYSRTPLALKERVRPRRLALVGKSTPSCLICSNSRVQVCIVGAGAIGGLVAVRLAASGQQVSVFARGETLAAIASRGLTLIEPDGTVITARNLKCPPTLPSSVLRTW